MIQVTKIVISRSPITTFKTTWREQLNKCKDNKRWNITWQPSIPWCKARRTNGKVPLLLFRPWSSPSLGSTWCPVQIQDCHRVNFQTWSQNLEEFNPRDIFCILKKFGFVDTHWVILYIDTSYISTSNTTLSTTHEKVTNVYKENKERKENKSKSCWERPELTNMNDVSCSIQHDIAIVPVLDLQQEAHQGIRCHGLYKVGPCLLESVRIFVPIYTDEILVHPSVCTSAQLVPRLSIGNTLNYTTLKHTE